MDMGTPESVGDQHLHRLAEHLVPLVSEQPLRLGVDQGDPAVDLDADDGVRSGFQQAPKLGLRPLTLADVADGSRDQDPRARVHRVEADLGRELRPVLAAGGQLHPGAHRARSWVLEIASTVGGVDGPYPVGDQDLQRLAEQLLPPVTEELFRLGVHQDDHPVRVNAHDGVRGQLEQPLQQNLLAMRCDRHRSPSPRGCSGSSPYNWQRTMPRVYRYELRLGPEAPVMGPNPGS